MPKSALTILESRVAVPGLKRSLRLLHATDFHLCECDRQDSRQRTYLAWRNDHFGDPRGWFEQLVAAVPQLAPDFVALTGDLIESATHANLRVLEHGLRRLRVPYGMTFGNHDWDWPENGSGERRPVYRRQLWARFAQRFGRRVDFEAFALPGVQLVFLDNSDYQVTPAQLRAVERTWHPACAPTVLFYHVPVALPSLRPAVVAKWKDPILCGEPDWDRLGRARWRVAPRDLPSTRRFRQQLRREPKVAGAFCGHVHFAHSDRLRGAVRQFVTPPLYEGCVRLITLVPG